MATLFIIIQWGNCVNKVLLVCVSLCYRCDTKIITVCILLHNVVHCVIFTSTGLSRHRWLFDCTARCYRLKPV